MKCKRCGKRDGTLCDACILARQKEMKKQIHARNRIIKEMKNDISAACWEHEQNKALKAELTTAKRHEADLRALLERIWIQCDTAKKPSMCWDLYHELEREFEAGRV